MNKRRVLFVLAMLLACLALGVVITQSRGGSPAVAGGAGETPEIPTPPPSGSVSQVSVVGSDERVVAHPAAVRSQPGGRVRRERALVVRCVTAEGDLLPGCRLLLRSRESFRGQRPYERPLAEVADGVHSTEGLPLGRYDVVSSVPNIKRSVAELDWRGEASEAMTVVIASKRELLAGIVRTPGSAGVASVLVQDHGRTSQAYFCVTDDRGRFLFCRKPSSSEATATLRVSSRRGGSIADAAEPVELFWGSLDAVIHAQERASVVVRLSDRAGRRIESFAVRTESTFDGVRVVRSAEAADGVARLPNVPTGRARVLVVSGREWAPARGSIDVGADGSGEVHLTADVAATLEGRVVATDGGELAGLDVLVQVEPIGQAPPAGDSSLGSLRVEHTGAPANAMAVQAVVRDGRFAFGCDPSVDYAVRVTAPGHAPYRCVVASSGGIFPMVEATLVPTATVRASFVPAEAGGWLARYAEQQGPGALGKTCCFALTEVDPSPGSKRRQIVAIPDAAGSLEFDDVSTGAWYFQFRGPLSARLVETLRVDGAAVPAVSPVDLEHLRPGSLQGFVSGGAGIGRAVRLAACREGGQMQVPIGEDGGFRMSLPGGRYLLRVKFEKDGTTRDVVWPTRVQIRADGETQVRIPMVLQSLRIRVLAEDSGKPIPGARLSIDEDRAFGEFRSWVADESGVVTVEPCPVGAFGVSMFDAKSMKWTHLQQVAADGNVPVVVRVRR